jgi:hypothetical protein
MNPSYTRTWLAPLLLATILAAGALIVWIFVYSLVGLPSLGELRIRDTLKFSTDGRTVLVSVVTTPYPRTVYRTLDGQEIEPDSIEVQSLHTGLPGPVGPAPEESYWRHRVHGFGEAHPVPTFWYLVHDDGKPGHAYFVGYDAATRRRVGYIGLKGFDAELPGVEQRFLIDRRLLAYGSFAGRSASEGRSPNITSGSPELVYVVANESLHAVDLERRTVEAIALPGKVLGATNLDEPVIVPDERHVIYRDRIAVRLADQMLVLSLKGETLRSLAIPDAIRNRSLALYTTTGPESVLIAEPGRKIPAEIYWFDAQGNVARHEQHKEPYVNRRAFALFATTYTPVPLLLAAGWLVAEPLLEVRLGDAPDFRTAVAEALSNVWAPLLMVSLVSATLAVVAFRRQRRLAGRGALAWAAFVFLVGPPGLVGYWLHRRWPPVERCEKCGVTVPRDRQQCLVCAAEFAPPAREGIEVFA